MKIDADEVRRALKLLFCRHDVFEIRALDAITKSYSYPHVESGYFDYEHIDEVPKCLEAITGAKGVYVTVNPVNEALLCRANNRMFNPRKEPRTTDRDIKRRRWLFLDCDAKRPSGIPSNDDEHEYALAKAEEIRNGMASIGWPEPAVIDSGNGAHLLYAIDMPPDDGGVTERIVRSISYASDENVDIDRSVFNPARIIRLPGTFNCKGDGTDERPHRMASIISIPEDGCKLVSIENLIAISESETKNEPPTIDYSVNANYSGDFNLDEWIRTYCPEAREPIQTESGRKWLFRECPFNPEHKSPDSYMFQYSNGRFYFKCSHNSCSGYDFHSLRDLREPGWRDKYLIHQDADVNISGMMPKSEESGAEEEIEEIPEEAIKERDDMIKFPEELYNVGGFIGRVMKFTLDNAPVPNRILALSGALSLMSILSARKVKTRTGLRGNIYILALAKSGSGKEFPRDVNQKVLEAIGLDGCVIENFASGEGLEDTLIKRNAILWQCDEFYSVLHDMTFEYSDNRNTLMKYLLTLYTSSHKNFTTRAKSGVEGTLVVKPHLTLYASTTPNGFFDNMTERFINDGMFARLNVVIADEPKRPQIRMEADIPQDIIDIAKLWRDYRPTGSGNIDVEACLVPSQEKAIQVENEVTDLQFKMMEEAEKCDNPQEWKQSAWNRYYEITMRYALLYACSMAPSPDRAVITEDAVRWAGAFVRWEIENKIHMTEHRYYRSEFEKQTEMIIDFMKRWHGMYGDKPMEGWRFSRKIKFMKESKLVLDSLIRQKRLVHSVETTGRRGRPAECYYLPQFAPGNGTKKKNKRKESE